MPVPHRLLPDRLRKTLPLLQAQRHLSEPMVFARFGVPDEPWQFFPCEGEPSGFDYLFFGLLMPSEDEEDWKWVEMSLSELAAVPGAMLDEEFSPATFPDAVRFPYME